MRGLGQNRSGIGLRFGVKSTTQCHNRPRQLTPCGIIGSYSRAFMKRRIFLGAAVAGLSGCARHRAALAPAQPAPPVGISKLMPVLAQVDRIFRVTVCLRPFRAAGPRLDVEKVGDKTVVHNYGHGGSGWSLSWGSSSLAVEKAMAAGQREVAVIGCGALGLTSAILLQRAG